MMGQIIENHLFDVWQCKIKPDSREILAPRGSSTVSAISSPWSTPSSMKILGHIVHENCSIRPAWNDLKSKLWRAYFALVKATKWKRLGTNRKCSLISRTMASVVRWATSSWPPQEGIANEMNTFQRKIFGMALGIRKLPLEEPSEFSKRRARWVRGFCERYEWWSRIWYVQSVKWEGHLQRDWNRQRLHFEDGVQPSLLSTSWSLASLFRFWHGEAWLANHTTFFTRSASLGTTSKRTSLRGQRGVVQKRWHEGIALAQPLVL